MFQTTNITETIPKLLVDRRSNSCWYGPFRFRNYKNSENIGSLKSKQKEKKKVDEPNFYNFSYQVKVYRGNFLFKFFMNFLSFLMN